MTGMKSMDANLVRTPCDRAASYQGAKFVTLFDFKTCFRGFAFAVDANDTLPALQNIFQQRGLHHFDMGLPLATHQRQVIFLHPFLTQLLMQRT
ncbi:hypothetical protein D3C80_1520610 [compost metagenome]